MFEYPPVPVQVGREAEEHGKEGGVHGEGRAEEGDGVHGGHEVEEGGRCGGGQEEEVVVAKGELR